MDQVEVFPQYLYPIPSQGLGQPVLRYHTQAIKLWQAVPIEAYSFSVKYWKLSDFEYHAKGFEVSLAKQWLYRHWILFTISSSTCFEKRLWKLNIVAFIRSLLKTEPAKNDQSTSLMKLDKNRFSICNSVQATKVVRSPKKLQCVHIKLLKLSLKQDRLLMIVRRPVQLSRTRKMNFLKWGSVNSLSE